MVKSSNQVNPYENEENPLINKENPDKNDIVRTVKRIAQAVFLVLSISIPNAYAQEISHPEIPLQGVTVELNGGGKIILHEKGGEYYTEGDINSQNGTDSFEGTTTIDGVVFKVISNNVNRGCVNLYNDLLLQCDSNGDGVINTKSDWKKGLVSKDIAKKEHKCELRYNIAQGKERIAQGKERIAQLDKDNAQLDKDNAQLDKDNAQLDKDNAKLDKDNAKLDKDNAKLDKDNAQGRERIRKLKQKIINRLSK